jgi:hypothetical protein
MRQPLILAFCAILVSVAIFYRNGVRQSFQIFWSASGSAFNLAVFRIALFTTFILSVDVPSTIWYSQMPEQLRISPFALHAILAHLPITPTLARISSILLLVSCVLALVGLFTRTACWAAALLGLYVLGLSHFYGKVNHLHHHLIWFAALMAVSPCADVLSCDAIPLARRRADAGTTAPANSPKYALPLRFVWLLMGLIYFFPGFWKLWSVGLPWTENLRLQMYSKWTEFDGWTPVLRIDHHPGLCAVIGYGAILFETSFIFLIFFARLRPFLILAGLAFHNLTSLFMRISFVPLQAMYVSLVDWSAFFRWLGRRLFPMPWRIEDDGSSKARRRIASLRAFDIFGRFSSVNLRSYAAENSDSYNGMASSDYKAIAAMGTFLLIANIGFGLVHVSEAWPFACYPTFAFRAPAKRAVLTMAIQKENGQFTELKWSTLSPHFAPDHARGLQDAVLRTKDPRVQHVRFEALWKLWRQNHPELAAAQTVSFYKDTLSIIPEERDRIPLRRELLATLPAHD